MIRREREKLLNAGAQVFAGVPHVVLQKHIQ